MSLFKIEKELFLPNRIKNPVTNGTFIENKKGYYSIWITDARKLPKAYSEELLRRKSNLLYIGIGKGSLVKRLYLQELQHKCPATFFRSIGAILKYRPEQGSLVGRKNQNNYKFSEEDTHKIVKWIDSNLEVSVSYITTGTWDIEADLISKHTPLLNWTHNPSKFLQLKSDKDDCRYIARKFN